MIRIGTYRTREDAELARAALAAADIPSVLEADDGGGTYPFDLTSAARLLVADADATDATAVLSGSSGGRSDSQG